MPLSEPVPVPVAMPVTTSAPQAVPLIAATPLAAPADDASSIPLPSTAHPHHAGPRLPFPSPSAETLGIDLEADPEEESARIAALRRNQLMAVFAAFIGNRNHWIFSLTIAY